MKSPYLIILILLISTLNACKNKTENPPDINEQELITTVILKFTDSATSTETSFAFRDLDGVGGDDPTLDTVNLLASNTYFCSILFLDESDANDVEDITEEVLEEGADHHVCLEGLETLGITMSLMPMITTDTQFR